MRGTHTQPKSKNLEDLDDHNHLDESLKILEQLFEARLIDHIARPIDKKVKEEHIDLFKAKLIVLHERLKKIMLDATEKNNYNSGKGKSMV